MEKQKTTTHHIFEAAAKGAAAGLAVSATVSIVNNILSSNEINEAAIIIGGTIIGSTGKAVWESLKYMNNFIDPA